MNTAVVEPTKVLQTNSAIGESGEIHLHFPSDSGAGPWPFVVAIHGGGWRQGDQRSYAHLFPQKLLPLGIAVVLISYRKAPEFPFPAAYDDLTHVLNWLVEHGGEHGLDVSRCVLFGSSAGGHLAMLLATRATAEERRLPVLKGVAVCCGIMDMTQQFKWDAANNQTITRNFLQATPENAPELYRQASPVAHVHANMPPVWITHGDADSVVSIEQSREMVARLVKAGHQPIFHENPGIEHVLAQGDPPVIVFEAELLEFVKKVLEPTLHENRPR